MFFITHFEFAIAAGLRTLNHDLMDVLCRTMTAPVELIKCLRAIKKYAFSASDYPAVITLEDHLTTSLQAKAAEVNRCCF